MYFTITVINKNGLPNEVSNRINWGNAYWHSELFLSIS